MEPTPYYTAGSYDQEFTGDTNPSTNVQVSASTKSGVVGHDRTIDAASFSAMGYRYTHTNMAFSSYEDAPASNTSMHPSAHQSHITASESSYFGAARSGGDPLYYQPGFNHAPETLESSPYEIPQYNDSPYYQPQFFSHAPHAVSTQARAHHAHRPAPIYPANTTSTNQVPLISNLNMDVTTPTKASRRVKIVHTVEPDYDQVLSRYKIGYYAYGERSKLDAPITKCKLPRAYGKTEDLWRCGKKSCPVAKKYGFLNTTTKKSYSDKGSLTASSAQSAAVPALVAKSEGGRTASVQGSGFAAQKGSKRDLNNVSAQPQRERTTREAGFEDRDAKRRRHEFTEDPGEPEDVETDFFELQIEDEIPAGSQGVEGGLGLAGEDSYYALYPTNPNPSTTKHEDATAQTDAISVAGLKCAGFNRSTAC
ncbi:hypothetical protein LTR35_009343 [Friedmanniomyces endolithicus]|nr:hypothetical protein LTS00_016401 [Friedmanniomyces endolithicus]KAK0278021.1 hypothetical protein LTR35_009343 [Friedmanniomyces endolithicus]KAK0974306.1 hypothetical protein LTR54_017114 [Friedmanniomyces endolithicus]